MSLPPVKNFIDQHVFANLKQIGIPPSPICDDSTFLRRVSLDIGGRLPTLEETKAFLADKAPDKRDRAIEALINSPDYADYFANKWTALLKNQRTEAADITANFAFHAWMRDSLLANTPYDQLVRQILASTGTIVSNPPVAWYKRVKEPTTQVEDVAQLFLGVRMQCAQCHHHPFERWTQAEYYHMAAFFSQIGRKPTAIAGEDLIFHKRGTAQTEHRKTRVMLKPAGLGEPPLDIAPDDDPRLALADWMSKKNNPFFAKALVNRYWKHFFKRGLIEPEDDLRDTNPPTNPELIDALAKHFTDSNFDLKSLVRVIAQSHTYQLSAMPNEHNAIDRQAYSHFYPKRMTAEVLLDSIDMVTASKTDFADLPPWHPRHLTPRQQLHPRLAVSQSLRPSRQHQRLRMRTRLLRQPRAKPAPHERERRESQAHRHQWPRRATHQSRDARAQTHPRTLPRRLLPRTHRRRSPNRRNPPPQAPHRCRRQAPRLPTRQAQRL
jgi:hypothetical protein